MYLFPLFLFFFGTFIGSFLGVLIDRLPRNKSILGRSHCDYCKKALFPLDLIPVISFVFLKGRCRYCKKPLSFFYPIIEITTGLVFVVSYLASQDQVLQIVFNILLTSSLLVIFFADLKYGIIPDIILFLLTAFSIPYLIFSNADLFNHVLSSVLASGFFLTLYLATKGRGMGLGDVKFAGVLGLILGFPGIILALYLSFLTGSTASIILILWGKKKLRGDTISFGPFMVIGTFLTLFFSKNIMPLLLPFFVR